MKKLLLALTLMASLQSFAQVKKRTTPAKKTSVAAKERLAEIKTNYGVIVVKLYNETPLHRDNFIKNIQQKVYDSLLFHRVIQNFMLQGGNPSTKLGDSEAQNLGEALPGPMVPKEVNANYIHKKGALAAARDGNPEKASSNCQFYIVHGQPVTTQLLNQMECSAVRANNPDFAYTDAQRETYKAVGGTPFLDQNYTVFGEVTNGLEVIDKIAAVAKGAGDKPLENIWMKIRMLN